MEKISVDIAFEKSAFFLDSQVAYIVAHSWS
jgi:hypothetical protein